MCVGNGVLTIYSVVQLIGLVIMAKEKIKYYSLKQIQERKCTYNMIFGERSNGKTYAVLEYGIKEYFRTGKQLAIVRRWQEDIRGKRGAQMFANHVANGLVEKYSNGEWHDIYYYSGRWYMCNYDEETNKRVTDNKPFAFAFTLNAMEHDKSTGYPDITTVCFDEFLTRTAYLPDEFVLFMNVISTIVRQRRDVTIYMLGNTVNRYCPYFAEMGLNNVGKMKPGDIDVYQYGESELRVAVEYADMPAKKKPSDFYFAFDNQKLKMITSGAWELDIYPHKPVDFVRNNVVFDYFIVFGEETMHCEIVAVDDLVFTYIHRKTTPLKDTDNDLIYSLEYNPRANWARDITKPVNDLQRQIWDFFKRDKVFYQDNECGEVVRNYIMTVSN